MRYRASRKQQPKMDDLTYEASLQNSISQAASLHRWPCVYHTYDSRHSSEGFPDLIIAGYGRLIAWELKAQGENPDDDQERWIDTLSKVEGPPIVEVIRPQDLDRCLALLQRK